LWGPVFLLAHWSIERPTGKSINERKEQRKCESFRIHLMNLQRCSNKRTRYIAQYGLWRRGKKLSMGWSSRRAHSTLNSSLAPIQQTAPRWLQFDNQLLAGSNSTNSSSLATLQQTAPRSLRFDKRHDKPIRQTAPRMRKNKMPHCLLQFNQQNSSVLASTKKSSFLAPIRQTMFLACAPI
jgi:hypothetical protein